MLILLFWVVVSLFGVIGFLECALFLLEVVALRKVRSISRAVWKVTLQGEVHQTEFLLNTLLVKSAKLDFADVETVLVLEDGGLTEQSRKEIAEYCEKNPWVRFTVRQDNDII